MATRRSSARCASRWTTSRTICARRFPACAPAWRTLCASPPDAAGLRDALGDALEEAERVQTIIRTLMDVTRAEAGVMQLDFQPIALERPRGRRHRAL